MVSTAEMALAGEKDDSKRSRVVGLKVPTRPSATRRVGRTCRNQACNKNPYFGWHGEKALFCVTHKEPGMVDVKNKRCEAEGCMKRGLFGYDGERARFCGGHRLEGMVDLKNKRCKWVGCAKQANFAAEGKSTACFCSEHRSPGMVDVKGRRCEFATCTKIAAFGVEGCVPSACLLHRSPGMVDMKQHRPRLGGVKSGGINVMLGNGGVATEAQNASFAKWGKRSRKNDFGASGESGQAQTSGIDSSSLDLPKLPRHSGGPSAKQWYSDNGYSSGVAGQHGSHAMRSWGPGGDSQQLSSSSSAGTGVPTVGMWAFDHQASASSSPHGPQQSCSAEASGAGLHQHPPHWVAAQETSSGGGGGGDAGNDVSHYPGPHESGVLPAMVARGCSSLPTLSNADATSGRFAGGGGYGGDGLAFVGGGSSGGRASAEGWRLLPSAALAFGDGLQQQQQQQQYSGGHPSMDQHGYVSVSSLVAGAGGGSNGGGVGRGGDGVSGGGGSSVKAEHRASPEAAMTDVEPDDIWLRDLMQEGIPRENGSQHGGGGGGGGGGTLEMPHSAAALMGGIGSSGMHRPFGGHGGGSQQYPRHLTLVTPPKDHAPSVRSGAQTSVQGEGRRSYHYAQHRQHQHSQQRQSGHGGGSGPSPQPSRPPQHDGSSFSAGKSGRVHEAAGGHTRTKSMPMMMSMGRSPSTASSGASPPHESGNATDAMPQGQPGKHDGVGGGGSIANGGGGGNPGIGGNGFISRTGSRGAGTPNHFMSLSAMSAMSGYDGSYPMGMNSEMQFLPSSRVTSPGWGPM